MVREDNLFFSCISWGGKILHVHPVTRVTGCARLPPLLVWVWPYPLKNRPGYVFAPRSCRCCADEVSFLFQKGKDQCDRLEPPFPSLLRAVNCFSFSFLSYLTCLSLRRSSYSFFVNIFVVILATAFHPSIFSNISCTIVSTPSGHIPVFLITSRRYGSHSSHRKKTLT